MTLDEETYSIEKMTRKIDETEEYLVPLAQNLRLTHPFIIDCLINALIKAKRRLIKKQTQLLI
jgi:hypothetical protein